MCTCYYTPVVVTASTAQWLRAAVGYPSRNSTSLAALVQMGTSFSATWTPQLVAGKAADASVDSLPRRPPANLALEQGRSESARPVAA